MSTTLLLASALIPTFFLLWYLCSRDANPEPPGVVIRTFLLGALVTLPIVPVAWGLEALGHNAMGVWPKALVGGFLGAAIPEELFKFLVLRGWVWRQKDFDEPMDGIVYGAAASLGFAALENVLYVSDGGFGVATLRALSAVPCHALTGVVMGYFAGRAKFAPQPLQFGLLAKGVVAAILLHGVYDTLLLSGTAWAFAALPVLLLQFHWGRKLIAEMRAEQLAAGHLAPVTLDAALAIDPAATGLPSSPAPSGPRHRSFGALTKIVLGAASASAGALFLISCALTALDPQLDPSLKVGLAVAALGTAAVTLFGLWLFRSGLRGPFTYAAAAQPAAHPSLST